MNMRNLENERHETCSRFKAETVHTRKIPGQKSSGYFRDSYMRLKHMVDEC